MSNDKLLTNKYSRQSNELIESPYANDFSPYEIKIFELALAFVNADDITKFHDLRINKQIELSNSELASILGVSKSSISHLTEDISRRIMHKSLHLRKKKEDGTIEFEMINIIPYASYKDGIFHFEFNHKVLPYLVDVTSNFTEFKLANILALSSSYSVKLYKLLYRFKSFGHRIITLEDLRIQLGLTNKYATYFDLKKRVISPSIEDINENSDIYVEFEEIRSGRTVSSLKFKFQFSESVAPYKQLSDINQNISPELESQFKSIIEGIQFEISEKSKNLVLNYFLTNGAEYIEEKLKYTNKNAKVNFEIFFIRALEEDWKESVLKKPKINLTAIENRKKAQAAEDVFKKEKQDESANQSVIESDWHKLSAQEKDFYLSCSKQILSKHEVKLKIGSFYDSLSACLHYCIFAVTTDRSYKKVLEGYCENILKAKLNMKEFV